MLLRRLLAVAAIALAWSSVAASGANCGKPRTDRECLTSETRAILERAEGFVGRRFELASTCRPCATIAGSGGHASEHAFGRAVDLKVPRGVRKWSLMRWFFNQDGVGLVMSYRNMPHIHFDTGRYHKLVTGADAYGGMRARRSKAPAAAPARDLSAAGILSR